MQLGRKLRQIRRRQRQSLAQVGEAAGLDKSTGCRLERADNLEAFCRRGFVAWAAALGYRPEIRLRKIEPER